MAPRRPVQERLEEKLMPTADGCLEFSGQRDKDGYGRIQIEDYPHGTHRVAFELAYGPVPEGLKVLHHCDNPPCCNPEHLFAGTTKNNTDDMRAKGRDGWAYNAKKTHCSKGHPFNEENTRLNADGSRTCRTCKGWTGLSK